MTSTDAAQKYDRQMPVALPFVIAGRRRAARGDEQVIDSSGGREVAIPTLDEVMAEELLALDSFALVDVPLQEIISFLGRVGMLWRNEEYARRRLWIRHATDVLGYSDRQARDEADWISLILTSRRLLNDSLDIELGGHSIVDTWVRRGDAYVRAYPRGKCLHVLAGNVPLSGVLSIVRALITKNVSVVKCSSRDVLTPVCLALSFLDVDPRHPVARALNVVHWPSTDAHIGANLAATADVCCVWGSQDAVDWARRHARADAALIVFGPKRSMAMVGRDADLKVAAHAIAHDVCGYDQGACFSTRTVFTELSPEHLVPALTDALDEYERLLPPGQSAFDGDARVSLLRLEEAYLDNDVHFRRGRSWTIVVGPPDRTADHPLRRTLYIHPVAGLEEAYAYIDDSVQTVTMVPWSIQEQHRESIARRGCSRMAEAGLANVFRSGTAHDGLYPLQHLVRLVAVDAPARDLGTTMAAPINQTIILRHGRVTDFDL
jgi:long-chain-fatty-acyl-CoA reductase